MEKLNVTLMNDSEVEETVMHINPIHMLNYLVFKLEDSINLI